MNQSTLLQIVSFLTEKLTEAGLNAVETFAIFASVVGKELPMSQETNLTLEQRLQVQIFETRTQDLSLEQAQEFLLEMFRQILVKDNLFAKLTES